MKSLKNGFTLAEVLITLAVLGVVFIFSIWPLFMHLNKSDVPAKLKKVHSTFAQMSNTLISENGTFQTWNWGSTKDAQSAQAMTEEFFKPKLSIGKYCGLETNKGCFKKYNNLNNSTGDNPDTYEYATKFIINDGTSIAFETVGDCDASVVRECGIVTVDINGPTGPNRVGRDVFFFAFYSDSNFLPLGYYEARDTIEQSCSRSSDGRLCAAKIALDSWDLSQDGLHPYPW